MEKLEVKLDDNIKDLDLFKGTSELQFEKSDIFKYGIMNHDIPETLREDAFDYFQRLIPAFEVLYSDHINIAEGVIYNNSTGESKIKVSEMIGVGLGLLYFINILGIPINNVHKIPAAESKKKYLDFEAEISSGKYQLECKGTVNEKGKKRFLDDINAKKSDNKDDDSTKIGTVTFARKSGEYEKSYMFVTDDYLQNQKEYMMDLRKYFMYYSLFFSFTLDSTYYNRAYENFMSSDKAEFNSIIKDKFYTNVEIDGTRYYGECFDRRLDFTANDIDINITDDKRKPNINKVLNELTKTKGVFKYFIGVDEKIIDSFNTLGIDGIKKQQLKRVEKLHNEIDDDGDFIIKGDDGLIFIRKSGEKAKAYFRSIFSDEEVKKRLALYVNFLRREPHECGAECTSWGKEGKSCEILTYRDHCHFHR